MERINFQLIEAKWKKKLLNQKLYNKNGKNKIKTNIIEYLEFIQSLNVGEIYLNSILQDGTGFGYDFETIEKISSMINIPLIIAGGAGKKEHLLEGLKKNYVDAVATANLFNFIGNALPEARKELIKKGFNVANWS